MALSFVRELVAGQATQGASATVATLTTTADATAGDLVTLVFCSRQTSLPTSMVVTDTRGNTWSTDAGPTFNNNNCIIIASTVQNVGTIQSGDVITITVTGGGGMNGNTIVYYAEEFTGNARSGYFDKSNTSQNAIALSGDSGSTGTLTQAAEIVVAGIIVGSPEASGITASAYTAFPTGSASGTTRSGMAAYKIVSAKTAESETFNWSTTADFSYGAIATYKALVAPTGSFQ